MKQFKIDLHTHSIVSYDGGIREKAYQHFLESGMLDCIAITDHNQIFFGEVLRARFGDKIIIGEEITTTEGEIIGLFLEHKIRPGMSAQRTVAAIHDQDGLVYIPHPFEIFRKGVKRSVLEELVGEIDIIETWNARGRFRGKAHEADEFARAHQIAAAASSDAHGYAGIGSSFSTISKLPTSKSLVKLLREGTLQKTYAPMWTYLYPAMNKIKNKIPSR